MYREVEENTSTMVSPPPSEAPPLNKMSSDLSDFSPEPSMMSDTVNDCISEGQWMMSLRSEGEVLPSPVNPGRSARTKPIT